MKEIVFDNFSCPRRGKDFYFRRGVPGGPRIVVKCASIVTTNVGKHRAEIKTFPVRQGISKLSLNGREEPIKKGNKFK